MQLIVRKSSVFVEAVFATFVIFLSKMSPTRAVTSFSQHFGVILNPYTEYGQVPEQYTVDEITSLVHLVSTRFSTIYTEDMGTLDPHHSWHHGLVHSHIACAAANLNNSSRTHKLTINLGLAYRKRMNLFSAEVRNGFAAAAEANKIFPNTVQEVSFICKERVCRDVQDYERFYAAVLNRQGVWNTWKFWNFNVGLATNCDQLLNYEKVQELLEMVDFVRCEYKGLQRPRKFNKRTKGLPGDPVMLEMSMFQDRMERYQDSVTKIKMNLTLIAQPVVPASLRKGEKGQEYFVRFWTELNSWAKEEGVRVAMWEAFDVPTRDDESGLGGSGWWERLRNGSSEQNAFREKVDGLPGEEQEMTGWILVAQVSILVMLLCGALMACGYFRLMSRKHVLSDEELEGFFRGCNDGSCALPGLKLPYDQSYEIRRNNMFFDSVIGSGAFGVVYKGTLSNSEGNYAFKVVKAAGAPDLKEAMTETKIMIHVGPHPYVVCLVGACTNDLQKGRLIIVTEYCDGGSLELLLRALKLERKAASEERRAEMLSDCVRWCKEIACGMEHISSKNVIHSDLAARNILIKGSSRTAQITDFGLSRHLYEKMSYQKTSSTPIPWRWMAVEALQTMTFSTKSDVWSYGVTMWEIYSFGDVPYQGLSWDFNFAKKLEEGLRMPRPDDCPEAMYRVMRSCWSLSPENRPSFSLIACSLQAVTYENEGFFGNANDKDLYVHISENEESGGPSLSRLGVDHSYVRN